MTGRLSDAKSSAFQRLTTPELALPRALVPDSRGAGSRGLGSGAPFPTLAGEDPLSRGLRTPALPATHASIGTPGSLLAVVGLDGTEGVGDDHRGVSYRDDVAGNAVTSQIASGGRLDICLKGAVAEGPGPLAESEATPNIVLPAWE